MNRKFSILAVILVLSMLLAACGTPAEAPAEPAAPAAEEPGAPASTCPYDVEAGAVITFSGWGDEAEQQIYKDTIERFKAICPEVTVNYTPIPADFQTKLKAQMAGGTAPDVFYIDDQLITAFAASNQIMPLDDMMAAAGVSRDDFIPALLTIFTKDGKTYALPKDWGTLGLVYLPDAFAEVGVEEPTEDWTWDDMRAAAQKFAEHGKYGGFCMGPDWARFSPFATSYGGGFATADFTAATLNSPEVQAAATFVADMFAEGSLVRPADISAGWCGEAIGKQLVAMTTEGGWMVNTMKNDYADVNWKAIVIPSGPANRSDVIFTNGIGVNSATPYPKAAAAFVFYTTGLDNQAEIVKTGFAYSTHPEHADLIVDENDKLIAQGGLLPDTIVAYYGPNTGKVNDAVSQALERIFLGDQDVVTAMEQAQSEAQSALDTK